MWGRVKEGLERAYDFVIIYSFLILLCMAYAITGGWKDGPYPATDDDGLSEYE